MPELRQSLRVLVEHPPAAPVAVERVAARAARFRRRRHLQHSLIGVALIAFASVAGVEVATERSDDFNLAAGGHATAGYLAERPGGYLANGTWTLTITRGEEVIELSSTTSDYCGRTGVIQPGDEVRGSITGADSTLRVGDNVSCPD